MEIASDHQIKLEPSFAGEEEIDIDANPPEDSKECINKKLQNNDLTIINFVHIKEEGSKDFINENNELQLSSSTSFPHIKDEIKTELTPSTHVLPSQVTDVSQPCKYSNLEKGLVHKEDKRNYNLILCDHLSSKKNIFLNYSKLGENSARSVNI
uniref:Uncharacterized protein n=1 Tax=Timema poppense TaxID=170557 RepID=A0A7R9DQB2_TIMPO|nr:unnamed protein product [Timema poppensis]